MALAYAAAFFLVFPAYITCVSYLVYFAVRLVYRQQYRSVFASGIFSAMLASWQSIHLFSFFSLRPAVSGLLGRKAEPARAFASGRIVILVHGAYHGESAWDVLDKTVQKQEGRGGLRFVYRIGNRDLPALVRELDSYIRRQAALNQAEEVLVVGHSLGGLMARYWHALYRRETEAGACPQFRVRGVISLCSPHGGMLLARLGPQVLFRSLLPGGSAIRELEALEESLGSPASVSCIALYSSLDNMVMPLDCLKVSAPGWELREVPYLSHLALLWHPRAVKAFSEAMACICGTTNWSRSVGNPPRKK